MNKIFTQIDYITEIFLLKIKTHIKLFVFLILIALITLLSIFYFIEKHNAKQRNLLSTYVSSQGYFVRQEMQQALDGFQKVYANSSGILEILAWSSVIDVLLEDKQHDAIVTLILDTTTLKQKPENILGMFSKAITVMHKIKKFISAQKQKEVESALLNFLQNLNVSKSLLPHKSILMIALSGNAEVQNFDNQNELTKILNLVNVTKDSK